MNQNPALARIDGDENAVQEALTGYFSTLGSTFGGAGGQSSANLNPTFAASQRVNSNSGLDMQSSFKNERGSFLQRQGGDGSSKNMASLQ